MNYKSFFKEVITSIERSLSLLLDNSTFNYLTKRFEKSIRITSYGGKLALGLISHSYEENTDIIVGIFHARSVNEFCWMNEALAEYLKNDIPLYFEENKFVIRGKAVSCIYSNMNDIYGECIFCFE